MVSWSRDTCLDRQNLEEMDDKQMCCFAKTRNNLRSIFVANISIDLPKACEGF